MPAPCPIGDKSCGEFVYSYADWGDRPVWMTHAEAKSFRGENTPKGNGSKQTGARRRKTRRSKRINRNTRRYR